MSKKNSRQQVVLHYARQGGSIILTPEQFGKDFLVFNFKQEWSRVLPHLHTEAVEKALDCGMRRHLLHSFGTDEEWNKDRAPWKLDVTYKWSEFVEAQIRKRFPGWEDKYKCPQYYPDHVTIRRLLGYLDEYPPAYHEEQKRVYELCGPRKDTPEYYQAFGLEYYLAGWCARLGQEVFPEYRWMVAHKVRGYDLKAGEGSIHTLAIGIHPTKRPYVIFDILNFTSGAYALMREVHNGFLYDVYEWNMAMEKSLIGVIVPRKRLFDLQAKQKG